MLWSQEWARGLTEEDVADARHARLLVRQPTLVRLEGREPDRHLRYDAGKHRAETLVERQRGLSPHDQRASRDEPSGFGLQQARTASAYENAS